MKRQPYDYLIANAKILPSWQRELDRFKDFVDKNKSQFTEAWAHTNIPVPVIAALNYRENGNNFSGHIHNGNPLTGKTYDVPAGRPKTGKAPWTWLESVIDCLVDLKKLNTFPWGDDFSKDLEKLESFNGFGYRSRDVNSPYIWSGTDAYDKGYFVRDHVFDPNAVNKQLGVFPMLKVLDYFKG